MKLQANNTNAPIWRNVTVKTELPGKLKKLEELSKNLWWVWNSEGKTLFHDLDRDLWREEVKGIKEFYAKFTYGFPQELNDELATLENNLK